METVKIEIEEFGSEENNIDKKYHCDPVEGLL
jgi:hypothetical protein